MQIKRPVFILALAAAAIGLAPAAAPAKPFFDGQPTYADESSRELASKLLAAHGGMQPWHEAQSLQFQFFTKMINNPQPFYSSERLNLDTGAAAIDWHLFDSRVAWDTERVWSTNWRLPLSPGFFVRLTSSFITLPWQIHQDAARIGPAGSGQLPNDEAEYDTLRITLDGPDPGIPGTFYELFIERETGLMRGLRFDINHPGMVENTNQPLGPNTHVFSEYRRVDGLILPTFYTSYGQGSASGAQSTAYHVVWDIRLDQEFGQDMLERPEHAVLDTRSMRWWSDETQWSANQSNTVTVTQKDAP